MDGIWFNHQTAQIFLLIYLTCFGSSMALFAVHFIYRYGAVNKPYLKQKFDLDIDQCTYIALYFWRPGPDGKVHPDIFSFIGVGILYLILSFSLFCVLYFGINCYLWISRKLGSLENQSQATKSLQTQLFYALLIQALIPFVLMYLPATIVFTFPMLNLDFDIKYPFMEITIALYPAIDPFPTILIIKHYRIAVIRILKCNRTNQISEDYSHGTSAVPKNMSNAVI
ncbi:hypothetical protein B9Z55_018063 [Caenorhabditis nigoni]|uniref:Seven TM Receptor n=1 Tax=Caenorhabditis nigoni TaxID=1611254 RepID=A0A2G5TCX3_9PELO|nr:hypothetical protein B9Z55_018063 [Caenorhabditis nigoni]